jgi:Amt family ammonium transporter
VKSEKRRSLFLPFSVLLHGLLATGNAFAFGDVNDTTATTFIGTTNFASVGNSPAFWFFEYAFSATSVTIVAGTLAERCQMTAYLCYSMFLAGFIYPVVAHSVWSANGFLSNANADPFLGCGAIDFAGSGVVHLTGGVTALIATSVLGPRRGRFYDAQGEALRTPMPMPGHSIALQLLGTMVLWFGWFGFNPGSALLLFGNDHVGEIAAHAAVSTALSGAAGGIMALFTNFWLEERRTGEPHFSLVMTMNGSLSGLVAITAGCGVVEPWGALCTGAVSGWIYIWSTNWLVNHKIDDAVDAIPVHMFNGIWGLISVGLFASPRKLEMAFNTSKHVGLFYSWSRGSTDATLLACQTLAALFILGWTFSTMMPFFVWLNYKGWLRSDSLEELVGLDISYHGGGAGSTGGEVKKEYVEAYRRHRGGSRQSSTADLQSAGGDTTDDLDIGEDI